MCDRIENENTKKREWCWPFGHDWGRWGLKSVIEHYLWGASQKGTVQVRECKRCGQIQTQDI